MWRLVAAVVFLVACGKDSTGPGPLAGQYCLSSWNYQLVTDVGDTLRTTGGGTYGAAVCMTFQNGQAVIAPEPPNTPTYADAVLISQGVKQTGPIYVWYGNQVTVKVFEEDNRIYFSDADGDLYWLAFSKTEITREGRTIHTDLAVAQNGIVAGLSSIWVQR